MNLPKVSAVFLLLTSLAACGPDGKPPAGGPGGGMPQVSVMTLQPQKVTLSTQLPGRTSALRIAEIRPQVNGLIQKRRFTEGAQIKAGDVLYQIDPAPFQAALDNARAALGRSEANLPAIRARAERFKELLAEKAVSQQDYDDAAGALKQAEADIASWEAPVESARINLAYTSITAPISGRIGKSSVTDGAIVTAYQPLSLATIQQFDPIYVDVPQSSSDLLRLRRRLEEGGLRHEGKDQNKVGLLLEDGRAYTQQGTLEFRDVSVDPTTGSVTLRMIFPNPQGMLLPGMFVRATVQEGAIEQAILVPQQGVLRNPKGEPYAFVVDKEGKVGMKMLTLEREIDDQWLVSAGLAAGDRVIVEGLHILQRLRPGTPVTVKAEPFQPGATPPAGTQAPAAANGTAK
jgi:membrane fusion protein (multidrug efflux system)